MNVEEFFIGKLSQFGVRPNWLGKNQQGELKEFVSLPWVAGKDVFVLVSEPNKPDTTECVDARTVKPLQMAVKFEREEAA